MSIGLYYAQTFLFRPAKVKPRRRARFAHRVSARQHDGPLQGVCFLFLFLFLFIFGACGRAVEAALKQVFQRLVVWQRHGGYAFKRAERGVANVLLFRVFVCAYVLLCVFVRARVSLFRVFVICVFVIVHPYPHRSELHCQPRIGREGFVAFLFLVGFP